MLMIRVNLPALLHLSSIQPDDYRRHHKILKCMIRVNFAMQTIFWRVREEGNTIKNKIDQV